MTDRGNNHQPPSQPEGDKGGYGRPPRHSQFKPGQSGNRQGRPPGARNVASLVRSSLEEKVAVREGDRSRKISKLEIGIKRLANKFATTGDPKALKALADHCPGLVDFDMRHTLQGAVQDIARPNQDQVLAWYRDRVLQQQAGNTLPTVDGDAP